MSEQPMTIDKALAWARDYARPWATLLADEVKRLHKKRADTEEELHGLSLLYKTAVKDRNEARRDFQALRESQWGRLKKAEKERDELAAQVKQLEDDVNDAITVMAEHNAIGKWFDWGAKERRQAAKAKQAAARCEAEVFFAGKDIQCGMVAGHGPDHYNNGFKFTDADVEDQAKEIGGG